MRWSSRFYELRVWFIGLSYLGILSDYISYSTAATSSSAQLLKNKIMKTPSVRCADHGIVFEMETRQPFRGQLYVRNEYRNPHCKADFKDKPPKYGTGGVFQLNFNECGMRRQRMVGPKGIAYSVTMVVQFHDTFVTAMDKAYQIRCFYKEYFMEVTAEQVNVSPLTTELMTVNHPVPRCSYSIKHHSMDGPHATYVTIGDPVVHIFACNTDDSAYRMLVRDCYVDDGKEHKQLIIDSDGCTMDSEIVETPRYTDGKLKAFAEATVFKWPDEPSIYFTCQLLLCTVEDAECKATIPPNCRGRSKRAATQLLNKTSTRTIPYVASSLLTQDALDRKLNFDLEVQRLIVLDLDQKPDELFMARKYLGGRRKTTTPVPVESSTVPVTTATPLTLVHPTIKSVTSGDGQAANIVYTAQIQISPATTTLPPTTTTTSTSSTTTSTTTTTTTAPTTTTTSTTTLTVPVTTAKFNFESTERLQIYNKPTTQQNTAEDEVPAHQFRSPGQAGIPKNVRKPVVHSAFNRFDDQTSTEKIFDMSQSLAEDDIATLNSLDEGRSNTDMLSTKTDMTSSKKEKKNRSEMARRNFLHDTLSRNPGLLDGKYCYGPEVVVSFAVVVSLLGIMLVMLTIKVLYPIITKKYKDSTSSVDSMAYQQQLGGSPYYPSHVLTYPI